MELNQFRDVDLVIDKANDNFIQRQFVSQGDYRGRTLTVQVTDNGLIGKVIGLTLNLRWQNQASGLADLTAFECIDQANSIFRIEYPEHMMTPGKVIANIQVIQNGKVTHLKSFELTVQNLAGEMTGIVDKAEYGALVAVLANANKFRTDIDTLVINKVDKGGTGQVTPNMLSQATVDMIANGAVTNVGINGINTYNVADKAISANKTDFVEKKVLSSNHYDPANSIYGYYVAAANGSLMPNENYRTSGLIPIPKWAVKVARSIGEQYVFRDENFNFISGDSTTAGEKYATIPGNAKYVEFSITNNYAANFRVAFINNLQAEVFPPYEPFRAEYKIKNQSLVEDVVEKVVVSNNYFNPEYVQTGYYVHALSGFPIANADYNILKIDVPKWAKRVVKSYSEQCAFLNSDGEYISGDNSTTNNTFFDVPEGSKIMLCSAKTSQLSNFYVYFIAEGQAETLPSYDTYKFKYVLKESNNENVVSDIISVPSDFGTVMGAVNYINSNFDSKKTIEINPGEYQEALTLKNSQKVDIVGKNRLRSIIRDNSGAYENSPFSGSGDGYFSNLTFLATNDEIEVLPTKTSYAAHIDYVGEGTLIFEDCDFTSYQNSAVGIGTHENQTIIFRRCSLRNNTLPANDGGALYFHNAVTNGIQNQKLIFEDCYIVSETGLFLRIDDANLMNGGTGSSLDVTFTNCNFYSETSGINGISLRAGSGETAEGCIIGNVMLNPKSHGNNIDILNAY